MKGKVLMVQGTSSSAGKSLLVAGLCHLFARRGISVAPFKAQNMSNNAAVCADGSEIGRAQANQAFAAGIEAHVDMNPVLIKPEADARAQIVLMGKAWKSLDAEDYYPKRDEMWSYVTSALDRLREQYELVIIEGAGSAAELNLKDYDIVNMAVAKYANAPVLLVGDIDRGGIFAQLIGTALLLDEEERDLLKGFVINKFRGDISLFYDGVKIIEEKSSVPVLGIVPYLYDLLIPEEDSVVLEEAKLSELQADMLVDIAVIHLPRIANFDDFDALKAEKGVRLRFVDKAAEIGDADAIIIPGTKSTINDLAWLRAMGFVEVIESHAKRGGALVGICGGYQMLGENVLDPERIESNEISAPALGLLPFETIFEGEKATFQSQGTVNQENGWFAKLKGERISGYEIHMGRSKSKNPWLSIHERNGEKVKHMDGASSEDGKIWGCYMHGIFANDHFRRAWLTELSWTGKIEELENSFASSIARLADSLDEHLNMEKIERIIWEN